MGRSGFCIHFLLEFGLRSVDALRSERLVFCVMCDGGCLADSAEGD